jgi:hypothetical protein
MVRVRLAALAFAGGLLFLSGCSMNWDMLRPSNLLHRGCTDCEEVAMHGPECTTGVCPGGPLYPGSAPIIDGPNLFPPNPTPILQPGVSMPPATGLVRPNPLPQIVTIPQATTSPSPP